MVYRLVADAVVIVHFGFLAFVATGGLLAWRWPKLLWPHLASVAWGLGIITIGWECPLTPLEKHFRRLGGEAGYSGGFVDRYIEEVIYPARYTAVLRLLVATLIVVGWLGLVRRARARRLRRQGPRVVGQRP